MFFLLRGTIAERHLKKIKKVFTLFLIFAIIVFIAITLSRFTDDNLYAETIPSESFIQDPSLYSVFDYLSQWFFHNMYVLDNYKFETFNGQLSFQSLLELAGNYGIVDYNKDEFMKLRRLLWPEHYYKFTGYVAYMVYDFGYILATLFSALYYFLISRKCKVNNGVISLHKLFVIVLLIQIPLFSIFYSSASTVIFASCYLIPIFFYLRVKLKK